MKFTDLKLSDYIQDSLNKIGFSEATEIQSLCIPAIFAGSDVIGTSQTGSGKTFAYGIPALELIDENIKGTQVLIVCPTRELATQVCDEIRKLLNNKPELKVVAIYGGSDMTKQIIALRKNAQIVVGTPGRLIDHLERRTLKLNELKMVVLDEADEMLNMGFKEDVEKILKSAPSKRQMVLFSATMPKPILQLTKNFMNNPISIESSLQNKPQSFIEQYYVSVGRNQKNDAMLKLLQTLNLNTSIIFCNTKRMVDNLGDFLNKNGLNAVCMHGDKRQSERKRIMDGIKRKGQGVLIGTDVIARGIDINDVEAVFNFDFPQSTEYYIHRIGRTARAGKSGKSFTIVNTKNQVNQIKELEHETKNVITKFDLDLPKEAKSETNFSDRKKRTYGNKSSYGTKRVNSDNKTESKGFNRKKENTYSEKSRESKREYSNNKPKKFMTGSKTYNNGNEVEQENKKTYNKENYESFENVKMPNKKEHKTTEGFTDFYNTKKYGARKPRTSNTGENADKKAQSYGSRERNGKKDYSNFGSEKRTNKFEGSSFNKRKSTDNFEGTSRVKREDGFKKDDRSYGKNSERLKSSRNSFEKPDRSAHKESTSFNRSTDKSNTRTESNFGKKRFEGYKKSSDGFSKTNTRNHSNNFADKKTNFAYGKQQTKNLDAKDNTSFKDNRKRYGNEDKDIYDGYSSRPSSAKKFSNNNFSKSRNGNNRIRRTSRHK